MIKIVAAVLALFLAANPALAQQRLLNIFNWSDYIDARLIDEFSKETGIRVTYDTYDSNEVLEAKLLAGRSGYDLVVPSGTFLQRQIEAGLLQPIDRSKLRNSGAIWAQIDRRLATYDPGNRYAINYAWFTTGIAYDVAKAKARLGGQQITSWDIIFKPENLRKFADCGVYVLDSPEDIFAIALAYLGLNPDSKNQADIAKASALLQKVRGSIRKFHSSEYVNALANGDICLAIGWSGDTLQARTRAREARNGVEIEYVIPKEGTLISLDNIAIPKDAANVAEAYAFIDFMLRPENAARNTTMTNFANGVEASRAMLPVEVQTNPLVYPDDGTMKRLFTVRPADRQVQRTITREWTRIKSGR
jgi:putrescine transport system substrate-binding protein